MTREVFAFACPNCGAACEISTGDDGFNCHYCRSFFHAHIQPTHIRLLLVVVGKDELKQFIVLLQGKIGKVFSMLEIEKKARGWCRIYETAIASVIIIGILDTFCLFNGVISLAVGGAVALLLVLATALLARKKKKAFLIILAGS